jgi:hypothetical protein
MFSRRSKGGHVTPPLGRRPTSRDAALLSERAPAPFAPFLAQSSARAADQGGDCASPSPLATGSQTTCCTQQPVRHAGRGLRCTRKGSCDGMLASISGKSNSILQADVASRLLENDQMTSINQQQAHRRARVALLLEAVGQTDMSKSTGIASAFLFQMGKATGTSARNVSDANARKIERGLRLDPGWIDSDSPLPDMSRGDDLLDQAGPTKGFLQSRADNDMDAMRYALGAICAVIATKRPAEGDAIARALRRAPQKFLAKEGSVHELIQALEAASRQAKARKRAPASADAGS